MVVVQSQEPPKSFSNPLPRAGHDDRNRPHQWWTLPSRWYMASTPVLAVRLTALTVLQHSWCDLYSFFCIVTSILCIDSELYRSSMSLKNLLVFEQFLPVPTKIHFWKYSFCYFKKLHSKISWKHIPILEYYSYKILLQLIFI